MINVKIPVQRSRPPGSATIVKIVGCEDPGVWYALLIGHLVEIEFENLDGYWAREGGEFNAINVIRKLDAEVVATTPPERALTCVYCGTEYPAGTAPHGEKVLTDHIKVCAKHPLREAEVKIEKLRRALIGLIGAETVEDLTNMAAIIQGDAVVPPDNEVQGSAINAIRALIETTPTQ